MDTSDGEGPFISSASEQNPAWVSFCLIAVKKPLWKKLDFLIQFQVDCA